MREWVQDAYRRSEGAPRDGRSVDSAGASKRVSRGGGWIDDAGSCRSAYRNGNVPGYRNNTLGFRPASAGRL